ncbi:P2X purinoceptor 7-like [Haemaphysalis longicornis]
MEDSHNPFLLRNEELGAAPYLFEPMASRKPPMNPGGTDGSATPEVPTSARLRNLLWCACNHCIPMGEAIECLCCREIPEIRRRLRRHQCVTLMRKFKAVCLDRAVLEVALKQRRRRLPPAGDRDSRNRQAKPWHQKSGGFNFKSEYHLCIAAFMQFALLTWGRLGKGKRRVLPSCVVTAVRSKYPSVTGQYSGFKHASIIVQKVFSDNPMACMKPF